MSALSLEELTRLQNTIQRKKTTSSTALMKVPSSTNSEIAPAPKLPAKKTKGLDAFEQSVGGRDELAAILEVSNLDKKQEHLLALLCDPKRKRDTLDTIAKEAGMRPAQVVELFRNAAFARAHAVAMSKVANDLQDVVDDIASKAVDARIECPTCFGAREINNVPCPNCLGKGEVMRFSDIDRQKIILDTAGLTKKDKAGVSVNVNQQVGIVNPGNMFSGFVKNSDDAAYAIDGETLDVE